MYNLTPAELEWLRETLSAISKVTTDDTEERATVKLLAQLAKPASDLDPERTVTLEFGSADDAQSFTQELEESSTLVSLTDPTSGSVWCARPGVSNEFYVVTDFEPPAGF